MGLVDIWKRRAWRRDDAAIAALSGSRPAVVITGGSDGIGIALAAAFATSERTIVLIARSTQKLHQAQSQLKSSEQIDALTIGQDITAPDAATNIRAFLAAHDLYADILINSAGIGTTGDFVDEPANNHTALTELNVTALTELCRAFLPDMLTRGHGGILNIASLGGFVPGPYQAAYYASKAYVISLTRAISHETRGQGVRVACLAPGPVNTAFHARARGDTALYRHILPAKDPDKIARSARRGYDLGLGVIIPGLFNNLLGLAIRLLPDVLTMPIVAILLKPRPVNSTRYSARQPATPDARSDNDTT